MARVTPAAVWFTAAASAGAITFGVTRAMGSGRLRADAAALAGLVALLVLGARFIRLRPPKDPVSRRKAVLSPRAKTVLLLVFGLGTAASLAHAALQAREGYPLLEPAEVIGGRERLSERFCSAIGTPRHEALYAMKGSEGTRYLVPLDTFEGRLLIVTTDEPPTVKVRVTGRLRDDLRTVQKDAEGEPVGPFVPLYREHMGLSDDTPIYFLDTSVRAGLNARAIALFVAPLYLFLLLLGAPVRAPR